MAELNPLEKRIISSFGYVRTAFSFDHFMNYFERCYGKELSIDRKEFKNIFKNLVEKEIFFFF